MTTRDTTLVLRYLSAHRKGAYTAQRLAIELGCDPQRVRKQLRILLETGFVICDESQTPHVWQWKA